MNSIKMMRNLWSLKRNEKKSAAEILALQDKKLKRLLHYAYEHSTYYRNSFERAGITAETIDSTPLSAFPAIDKSVLMSQFEEIVTVPELTQEELRRFDERETTGGELFRGRYHIVHSSGSTGTPKYFVYDEKAWDCMLLGIVRGALWDMSMPQIFRFLAHGPRIVYLAATNGRYGGAMAVSDGVSGVGAKQMYLTCLYNFVQPLIRYRLSDHLTLQIPDDSSRYPFTRAACLLGRNEDILWFQDGSGRREFLHPLAVEGLCIEGLCDYQFRQISPDTFEMLVEVPEDTLRENVREEILRQMKEILKEKHLEYVQFYVEFVPEILPDPGTGKKRLILAGEEKNR